MTASDAAELVQRFDPGADGAARKSQELVLGLLRQSSAPFSRNQFAPGHITCTALVLHPTQPLVLMMHHHRLHRWLLPGGHVEPEDISLAAAAAREAMEETNVRIDAGVPSVLAGIDVHGIPPKKQEPYHLHHDLIWFFRAVSEKIETSDEAPRVMWASGAEADQLQIAESIRQSIYRTGLAW